MTKLDELQARYDEVMVEIDELSNQISSCSKDADEDSCGVLLSKRASLSLEASELKDAIRTESRTSD